MAVVIRLQGLPIVAGTMDIRHFFSGLTIPDGGVHIVGGDHGEAFIVFATDEDARLGMMRTGGAIKGSKVSLLLSSKTEMQNMIELSRRRFESAPTETPPTGARPAAAAPPTAAASAPPRSAQFASPAAAAQFASPAAVSQFASPAAVAQFAAPAAAVATQDSKAPPNMASSFPNYSAAPSYSAAPTLTTALASLTPPLAALPNMAALPPMPSLPSLPPPAVPPVPPMSHLPHMTLPPFNPSLPPPLGAPNPLLFNPLTPLAPLGLQHMKSVSAAPPVAAVVTNPDDLILALQNLPYACSEPEVRDFFRGLSVETVRFVRDVQGRRTGRALVKFFAPQDSFEALKRGGGSVGQRYVEVSPSSERQWNSVGEKEAEHVERGRMPQSGPLEQRGRSRSPHRQDLCVYLKGLPYEADKNQVKEFFKNLQMDEDSLYIAYGPNGKATGEGFLEFKTEQDYKSALAAHMQYMGARFIQVHPISRKGMMEKIEQIRKRDSDTKSSDRTPKTCLHITNIPYNVSRKDVRAFLEGLAMYEETLNVLTDAHGNGLGQAVVQLESEEDARKAERLHRQKLNGRDAFVHLVTFEHMKEVERNPPPQNKRGQRPALSQAPPASHMVPAPSHMAPPPAHFGPINDDFGFIRNPSPFAPPFSAPGNGLAPPPIPPLGPGLSPGLGLGPDLTVPPPLVPGMAPVLDPPGFRPGGAGPPFGHDLRGMVPFERKTPTRSNGAPRPLGGSPPPGPDPALHGPPPPAAGANGGGPTVVKLQNMPFTVSADEIMDFLYGYAVVPGSVLLQYNDKGLPNGEAMVAFQSPEEAAAAVSDLNERPIGNRKVKMSLG